jgi:hypothetical protein
MNAVQPHPMIKVRWPLFNIFMVVCLTTVWLLIARGICEVLTGCVVTGVGYRE